MLALGVGLVLGGLATGGLALGVGPALAAPGPVGGLASPTHPDAASWYADPDPGFTWQASPGVAGYSYLIDHTPGTIPTGAITVPSLRFSQTTLTAGLQPWSIAASDLNGDGPLDLVVADYAANEISVLQGKGDGTFQNPVSYPVGTNPHGIALGDFNGDGAPDVAVANWGDATVSVLLNKGDGTLKPAVTYSVGSHPSEIAVGDFNRDGTLDLAVADYDDGTVDVLLGRGDGTFQPATSYPTGANAEAIVAGDFNGDGKLDLAVANWGASTVSVLLGNGNGTFQTKEDYAVGSNPHSIVAGDFNGDGTLDLAVANWTADTISVLMGRGNGSFASAATYAAGPVPAQLAVADLNGDGIPDLAVADHGVGGDGSVTIGVLLGKGDGTFMARQAFAAPADPHSLVAGDLDGDGVADLAVACNAGAGTTVALFRNAASAPFVASYSGLSDGVWYFHVRAVDTAGGGGPTATRAVRIATAPPAILAQRGGGTKRHTITLRYRVNDVTPLATSVSVVIRNARHRVVATFTVGTVTTGRWHTVRWVPTARGTFAYTILARDLAGNAPVRSGWTIVHVR